MTADEIKALCERVARTLCAHDGLDWDQQASYMTSGTGGDDQAAYRSMAAAVVEALSTDIARITAERDDAMAALREIKALESTPIGDTGFSVGPLALLNRAQNLARDVLKKQRAATRARGEEEADE